MLCRQRRWCHSLCSVLGDVGLALIAMAEFEDEEGAKTGSYTDSSAAAKDITADSRRVGMVRAKLLISRSPSAPLPVCDITMLQGVRAS